MRSGKLPGCSVKTVAARATPHIRASPVFVSPVKKHARAARLRPAPARAPRRSENYSSNSRQTSARPPASRRRNAGSRARPPPNGTPPKGAEAESASRTSAKGRGNTPCPRAAIFPRRRGRGAVRPPPKRS